MSPALRGILGPDFQTLLSKVLWTFVQTFGGFLISARAIDGIDVDLLNGAFVAGVAAIIVPITVYARMMIGGSAQPQLGSVVFSQGDDDIVWDD